MLALMGTITPLLLVAYIIWFAYQPDNAAAPAEVPTLSPAETAPATVVEPEVVDALPLAA